MSKGVARGAPGEASHLSLTPVVHCTSERRLASCLFYTAFGHWSHAFENPLVAQQPPFDPQSPA